MTLRLFHFVAEADIERFRSTGGAAWSPSSLATEGFIHLSFAAQLSGTLEVHFKDAERVLLVEVDPVAVDDALRVELSRPPEAFPHVYRAIESAEFLRSWVLERDANSEWKLPRLRPADSEDDPEGVPHEAPQA